MAGYNKFNDFVDQLGQAKHTLGTHTYKIMLVNSPAPTASNAVKADLTEIGAGNGYSAGGSSASLTWAEASGTGTATGTMVVFTASGGTIGPFRYVVLYNDTQTSPADPLVSWWDYGSGLTLQDGETFSVKFNNSATTGTIFTLA
jgi:hypothetical protein